MDVELKPGIKCVKVFFCVVEQYKLLLLQHRKSWTI